MSNNTDDFLSVGLKKYKQASATLVSFGQEMEERLQGILNDRATEKWAPFRSGETKRAKSTRYWSHYPLLNAKIDGDIAGTPVKISIDVNWYESESEYPFYSAWLEPTEPYLDAMREFT